MKNRKTRYLLITLFVFGLLYSLISIVNHYLFRTYALDLGLYTHALYHYGHFRLADSSMIKQGHELLLGGHFDLYLVIFSPMHFIFGTYTLLIIQIAAILAGAAGIYKYFRLISPENVFLQISATVGFLAFFGVFSAVSYDYHSIVVAASLIPWFFYYFRKRNFMASAILVIFILIAQENVALWFLFICLGLLIEYRKDRISVLFLCAYSVFSVVYFVTILYGIMPSLTNTGNYDGFTYSALGNTPLEAIKYLVTHPIEGFNILFFNHINHPNGHFVKLELHILVLLSGLYFLLFKPQYLVMLIPVYIQKMYHDNILVWGIYGQYSIEFAPILAIGIFSGIAEFRNRKTEKILAIIALAGIVLATFRVMDNTVLYTQKSRIRFYQAAHYQRNYDVKEVHRQLKGLPDNAKISAQTQFVPHLALRENIYQFPIINDAEYIVISEKEGKYPLDEEHFALELKRIRDSGEWEERHRGEGLVILRRQKSED